MSEPPANLPPADYRGDPESDAIRRHLRVIAAICAAILFALAAAALIFESPFGATSLEIDTSESASAIGNAAAGIDPNTATWAELALLPGLGESVSRRIIEFREERKSHDVWPAFRRPEDLMRVKGIGAKTLQRMRPLLRFPEPATSD